MDYGQWGAEYLEEADRLKKRVDALRKEFTGLRNEDAILLYRRIAMLYEMYLECLHTGRCLTERGEADEKEQQTESGSDGEYGCGFKRTGT